MLRSRTIDLPRGDNREISGWLQFFHECYAPEWVNGAHILSSSDSERMSSIATCHNSLIGMFGAEFCQRNIEGFCEPNIDIIISWPQGTYEVWKPSYLKSTGKMGCIHRQEVLPQPLLLSMQKDRQSMFPLEWGFPFEIRIRQAGWSCNRLLDTIIL